MYKLLYDYVAYVSDQPVSAVIPVYIYIYIYICMYSGADKSLARPTSRRISFDVSLVIYINNTNIPPIMYEHQNLLSL